MALQDIFGTDPTRSSDTSGGGLDLSSSNILGLGALGLGAGGLAFMLGKGEPALPPQFGQAGQNVTSLLSAGGTAGAESAQLFGEGQQFLQAGGAGLAAAEAGQLTDPQKAVVAANTLALKNKAKQMYASMGRNAEQDTSYINTLGDIQASETAMTQSMIQSSIQLALAQLQTGGQLTSQSLGFSNAQTADINAANQTLLNIGNAQLKQDQAYSDSLGNMFKSIGSLFGGVGSLAKLFSIGAAV